MGVSFCFLNFYLYKVVCYGYFNFHWSGLFYHATYQYFTQGNKMRRFFQIYLFKIEI